METSGQKRHAYFFALQVSQTIYSKSLEGPSTLPRQGRSAVDVARDSNHMDLLVEMQQKAGGGW